MDYGKPITLSDFCQWGSTIRSLSTDHPARVLRVSRNLRGLRDYARTSPVACVITRRDSSNPHNGALTVVYKNGALGRAHFASYSIMVDFVRNRRTWRSAEFRFIDGDMGYLTKPGPIA